MVKSIKVTFTLDSGTVDRIERTAQRLGIAKSGVVREAIADFAARADRLSAGERVRLLAAFDDLVPRIPRRPVKRTDQEIEAIRRARRVGGRRSEGTK